MNTTIKTKIALATAALLIAGPIAALAWTSAPATPPSSNVPEPVNAGDTAQSKGNYVLFNTGDHSNGLLIYGSDSTHGKVGIGTLTPSYKLQVGNAADGSSVGASAFFYTSDVRFKTDIAPVSDALAKVLQLRGVDFTWKTTGKKDVGVIAQEVEKVFPQVVNTGSDGVKAVEYGHLIGPLIEAIKAQQTEIDTLKAEVAALKASR